MAELPRNIYFLPHFYGVWEWITCLILQINTNILTGQQRTYMLTQETLHISFISKSNIRGALSAQLNIQDGLFCELNWN